MCFYIKLFFQIISNTKAKIYIDKYCYDLLKIIYEKEELPQKGIDKESFFTKQIINDYITKMPEENNFIFICQPIKEILEIIYQLSVILNELNFNIIFIPEITYDLLSFLSDNDLSYRFNIYNYNIDLIPIDNDLISLEKEGSFRQIYLNNDITPINDLANSFIKIEACFGKIKNKYIKGSKAKIFNDLLNKKEKEANLKNTEEILGMFVFDRSVDFIIPLVTNDTYEGLIDENFEINKGNIIIDESYFKEKEKKKDNNYCNKILYSLNSNKNEFFSKIRCMNYLDANQYLFELRKYFDDKTKKDDVNTNNIEEFRKVIEEINTFVTFYRGPILVNTKLMADIFNENIKEENMIFRRKERSLLSGKLPLNIETYYSDYMSDKKDLKKLLKLMCVESLTQGGIKDYNNTKKDILTIYGYQNIFLLRDLESIGLLKEKESPKKGELSYQQICLKLNLVNEKFTKENITDCSYLYRGYCPIIVRLIELGVEGKWNIMKDTIAKLPGDILLPSDESEIKKPNKKINTIFIVFIGGITYTEIEGIRYINLKLKQIFDKSKKQINNRIQLIIVTDEILSQKKIFNGFGKKFEQKFNYKKCFNEIKTAI